MTCKEKELLYNLLKTASSSIYGFSSPDFREKAVFSDDKQKQATIKNDEKSGYALPIKNENEIAKEKSPSNIEKNIENPLAKEGRKTFTGEQTLKSPMSLEKLSEKVKDCQNCALSKTRHNTVFGMGVENPYVLVIGEGPGEEEDKQGLPFVGPAGKLLDKMLNAICLDRNANCYIANVVKCRPPHNRDPLKEERDACRAFLDTQIHLLKPRYILSLGKVALRNLFGIDGNFSLSPYRHRLLEYQNIPMVVTYHPSALLRNPEYKKPAWEDLKFLRAELEKNFPEYKNKFQQ